MAYTPSERGTANATITDPSSSAALTSSYWERPAEKAKKRARVRTMTNRTSRSR
jgi:hypothetical protein